MFTLSFFLFVLMYLSKSVFKTIRWFRGVLFDNVPVIILDQIPHDATPSNTTKALKTTPISYDDMWATQPHTSQVGKAFSGVRTADFPYKGRWVANPSVSLGAFPETSVTQMTRCSRDVCFQPVLDQCSDNMACRLQIDAKYVLLCCTFSSFNLDSTLQLEILYYYLIKSNSVHIRDNCRPVFITNTATICYRLQAKQVAYNKHLLQSDQVYFM